LKNRKQKVKIGDTYSTELVAEYGIPQGSVLGPILFIFYINDLYQLPLKAKIIGYADDTSLLYTAETREQVEENFAYDFNILQPWFTKNQLHLNKEKCKTVIFAYKSLNWMNEFNLKTNNGDVIERVESIKYLGLIIDQKLTWKQHLLSLQEKLRKINFLFYHMANIFSKKHLVKLYTPLYESVLTYGVIHWGASAHIKPLKVLQNKVCRTILNLEKRTSESKIYPKMGVPKLEDVHKLKTLMFVFKNKNSFQIHNTVTYSRTGGGLVSAYPGWKKHHSRLQGRYQGYKLFNKLHRNLRNEKRLSTFKRMIKERHNKSI